MTAFKSTQETKRTATPPKMLSTDEMKGRIRVAYFDFTTPADGVAIGDTVDLVTLPKGARILGGRSAYEAMGAGATMQIGVSGDADKYFAAASVAAAGNAAIAADVATNTGDVLADETTVFATAGGANWAAGKRLCGHLAWVLD